MPTRIWSGVTDNDWFRSLRAEPDLDEVNFWQPSGIRAFRALQPGDLFLFKLHSPHDYIVGGGFFVRYVSFPYLWVWDTFVPEERGSLARRYEKEDREVPPRPGRPRRSRSAASSSASRSSGTGSTGYRRPPTPGRTSSLLVNAVQLCERIGPARAASEVRVKLPFPISLF